MGNCGARLFQLSELVDLARLLMTKSAMTETMQIAISCQVHAKPRAIAADQITTSQAIPRAKADNASATVTLLSS